MRVIVTGSRTWTGPWGEEKIFNVLDSTIRLAQDMGQALELIHGACPTGADEIADRWGHGHVADDIMLTTWPASWDLYGKAAGPVRNEQMMTAGGDLCVAFLRGNSSGTLDAIGKARRRGIWTVVIPWAGDNEPIELPRRVPGIVNIIREDGPSEVRAA